MKTMAFAVIALLLSSQAWCKELSMNQWVAEYNKHRTSTEAYLNWLSKTESKENIDFLRQYLKNPKIELRKLEVVNSELIFRGKKSYTRIKIISFKDGKFSRYGTELQIPVFKPLKDILKEASAKTVFEMIKDLFIAQAIADSDVHWNGEDTDFLTSIRLWKRTRMDSTYFDSGKTKFYCGFGNRGYNAVQEWFSNNPPTSDNEDNCYQLMLYMAKVSYDYNTMMESYPQAKALSDRMQIENCSSANCATASANASEEAQTPGCIIENIKTWKRYFCREKYVNKDYYKDCKIVGSNPPSLFSCGKSFEDTDLPPKIGISVQYQKAEFNTDGVPKNSGTNH